MAFPHITEKLFKMWSNQGVQEDGGCWAMGAEPEVDTAKAYPLAGRETN